METEELLRELKNRFDELMFIGYKSTKKAEDNYSISVKSTMHGSFGLLEVLKRATEAQHMED
jgi:lipid A disaccharide synthetase